MVQEEAAKNIVLINGSPGLRKAVLDEMIIKAKEGARLAAKPKAAQDMALAQKKVRPKAANKAKAPPADTVPKADYDKLAEKYGELQETNADLARFLEACDDVKNDKAVLTIQKLNAELKVCVRRRDELMNQTAEMRRQINWLEKELKKTGWTKGIKK